MFALKGTRSCWLNRYKKAGTEIKCLLFFDSCAIIGTNIREQLFTTFVLVQGSYINSEYYKNIDTII